jgi:hypothetical protein
MTEVETVSSCESYAQFSEFIKIYFFSITTYAYSGLFSVAVAKASPLMLQVKPVYQTCSGVLTSIVMAQ